MTRGFYVLAVVVAAAIAIDFQTSSATAQLYINEIFIDPPGSESQREYVELRGMPGMSLANLWFIVLENEDTPDQSGQAGSIDLVVDLSAYSIGSNGFLVMRQPVTNPFTIAPNTTVAALPSNTAGNFENSGGTYMLIDRGAGVMPVAGMLLDGLVDNDNDPLTIHDGLDYPGQGQPGWTIKDAIGVFSEGTVSGGQVGEAFYGRTYAKTNFGPEIPGREYTFLDNGVEKTATFQPNITSEQIYVGIGAEIELVARYGNSTGQGEKDWHATNVTDNGLAGYTSGNFVQAGSDPHGFPRPAGNPDTGIYESESSQYVPYGTIMTNTLGASNYPLNQSSLPWDYNQNGTVDAADYTVWRNLLGTLDPTGKSILANADRDGSVDQTDYLAWKYHFGESLPMSGFASSGTVPEPATWLLCSLGLVVLTTWNRRR